MIDFAKGFSDEELHQIRLKPRQHCDDKTVEALADTLLVARVVVKFLQEKLAATAPPTGEWIECSDTLPAVEPYRIVVGLRAGVCKKPVLSHTTLFHSHYQKVPTDGSKYFSHYAELPPLLIEPAKGAA